MRAARPPRAARPRLALTPSPRRRPDVDTLLRAECKLWGVTFVEPEGKKEKKDAKETRQGRVRSALKAAEVEYNTARELPAKELQNFFFHKPMLVT